MQQSERKYQELRQRLSQLQDIYLKTFIPYRKQLERGSIDRQPYGQQYIIGLNRVLQQTRTYYNEHGQAMVEFKVMEGLITLPKTLVDNGQNEKSPMHKIYLQSINDQIAILRKNQIHQQASQFNKVKIGQNKKGPQDTQQIGAQHGILKRWKRTNQKQLPIRTRLNESQMTTALVQAQKLNVLTLFDLDFFFDFCVALCNADI